MSKANFENTFNSTLLQCKKVNRKKVTEVKVQLVKCNSLQVKVFAKEMNYCNNVTNTSLQPSPAEIQTRWMISPPRLLSQT